MEITFNSIFNFGTLLGLGAILVWQGKQIQTINFLKDEVKNLWKEKVSKDVCDERHKDG